MKQTELGAVLLKIVGLFFLLDFMIEAPLRYGWLRRWVSEENEQLLFVDSLHWLMQILLGFLLFFFARKISIKMFGSWENKSAELSKTNSDLSVSLIPLIGIAAALYKLPDFFSHIYESSEVFSRINRLSDTTDLKYNILIHYGMSYDWIYGICYFAYFIVCILLIVKPSTIALKMKKLR